MNVTKEVAVLMNDLLALGREMNYEYVTPELMLFVLCRYEKFIRAFENSGGDVKHLSNDLEEYLIESMETVEEKEPEISDGLNQILIIAQHQAIASEKDAIGLSHVICGMFRLQESYAVYFMNLQGVEEVDLLRELREERDAFTPGAIAGVGNKNAHHNPDKSGSLKEHAGMSTEQNQEERVSELSMFAPCLNDTLEKDYVLIGREKELERTIQILSRKEKNNPLHIGEPGTGKTAITYGLVQLIRSGKVPDALKGARIFSMDLGSMLAGTQYRGEFEKRFKKILSLIYEEENPIIYIDEIHNLLGAGATGDGSFDASNMLKPYLTDGHIRFIGATTFEEYKKHFEKSKSMVRRFQNVEISEPGIEETVKILEGLSKKYEKFHGVKYGKGVLEYAVTMSDKYINERFLPDKAIDLMDEAGAYRKLHPLPQKSQTVGKDVIGEILTNICRVPMESVEKDEMAVLKTLEKRLLSRVFGQDDAVKQVVNAVKLSRAGLLEDHKPMASLLFVGPTGVGKTEIAKSLSTELGVKLIRFDMSEYEEKHDVAKLIGSPAGYVGYEEGGLLTEAIRKNPSCVLLLDEIEKAHPDIYHILLQVMDYATLTDNQGRKADFRNVIIIMTSNAGASQIGKNGIGFQSECVTSSVIMEEVKRIFQPEFRNRLNKIIVFKHIDEDMAERIAIKKLAEVSKLLTKNKVTFTYGKEVVAALTKKGVSQEFGAREIDRIITNEIKPLLVDELLFGKLKKGGKVKLTAKEDKGLVKWDLQ